MSTPTDSNGPSVDHPPPSTSEPIDVSFATGGSLLIEKVRKASLEKQLCDFDVEVLVPGSGNIVSKVKVHKDLLIMASPIFEFLMRQKITEWAVKGRGPGISKGGPLQISVDIKKDVFVIVRHYLYSNDLPLRMKKDFELSLRVLEASFQYKIGGLMEKTVALLKQLMEPRSAFKILQSARAVECLELEELAIETICRNPDQLRKNVDFLDLGCHDVCRILSNDALSSKETNVFQAAYSWALHQSGEIPSENPGPSLKYYFSQVSPCIRFPLMSPEELATATTATGDLLPYEETAKLLQHALLPEKFKSAIPFKYSDKPRLSVYLIVSDQSETAPKIVTTETPTDIPQKASFKIPPPNESSNPRKRVTMSPGPEGTSSISSTSTTGTPLTKQVRLSVVHEAMEEGDSDDDLFTTVINHKDKKVPTYEDAVRRYVAKTKEKNNVSAIVLSNLMIDSNHKSIPFRNCNEVIVDAKCSFFDSSEASFYNFVSHFDPMRYILFDTTNGKVPMTPENIWGLKQDILLKFNGVTFLKVKHSQISDAKKEEVLVLNYMSDSKRIMSQSKPGVLALSNCELSAKFIKDKGKHLEKLVLYRVWGDISLEEIMKECPNLTELICWKHVPGSWVKEKQNIPGFCSPLSLNFSNLISTKHNIRKLALFKTELKFPMRCTSAATSVTELVLELCYCRDGERNANITDVFHQLFPNLKKLIMMNDPTGNMYKPGVLPIAVPSLVKSAKKNIKTLEEITVSSMIWSGSELEDEQLVAFLELEANLAGKLTDLRLEKTLEGAWKRSGMVRIASEEPCVVNGYWNDKMEYDCYNLDYFYDSLESYEDYFKQDDKFPRPILWA